MLLTSDAFYYCTLTLLLRRVDIPLLLLSLPPTRAAFLRQQGKKRQGQQAAQITNGDQQAQILEIALGDTQRGRQKRPQLCTHGSRTIEHTHQRRKERPLNARRAQTRSQDQRGHEGYLAEHGQDHAVAEGEEFVGDAQARVEVVNQDELRQAELWCGSGEGRDIENLDKWMRFKGNLKARGSQQRRRQITTSKPAGKSLRKEKID